MQQSVADEILLFVCLRLLFAFLSFVCVVALASLLALNGLGQDPQITLSRDKSFFNRPYTPISPLTLLKIPNII